MTLRYRHIETALADILGVRGRDMGAFRGRLRHLRNIGVPRLPAPGSGQPIDYTWRQALEMLVALELENLGQAPKRVASLAGLIVRQLPDHISGREDTYAVVNEQSHGVTIAEGSTAFSKFMESAPDTFAVVNASALARKLDLALKRALGAA